MLFCSQRNNRNHKERKTNLIIKFLTANLRYLKICIPSKTNFSYSVKFSVESTRSDITFQDCISFYKCYKSAWHIQASLSVFSFLSLFCTALRIFGSSWRTKTVCWAVKRSLKELLSTRRRCPLRITLHLKVCCIRRKKSALLKLGSNILTKTSIVKILSNCSTSSLFLSHLQTSLPFISFSLSPHPEPSCVSCPYLQTLFVGSGSVLFLPMEEDTCVRRQIVN